MHPLVLLAALTGLGALLFGSPAAAQQRSLADGPPPDPPQPMPPEGYRRAKSDEVTQEMRDAARAALSNPIGTLLEHETWAIQIEWHFHEPGGPVRPWGWHKGATVYVR